MMMSRKRSYKVEEDLEVEPEIKSEIKSVGFSGYIAVRRIAYEVVNPSIKVAVGADVPQQIINDTAVFENLLSKKAIRKGRR